MRGETKGILQYNILSHQYSKSHNVLSWSTKFYLIGLQESDKSGVSNFFLQIVLENQFGLVILPLLQWNTLEATTNHKIYYNSWHKWYVKKCNQFIFMEIFDRMATNGRSHIKSG